MYDLMSSIPLSSGISTFQVIGMSGQLMRLETKPSELVYTREIVAPVR